MRRRLKKPPHPARRRLHIVLAVLALLGSGYVYLVQTAFKPTLEELAEYECRAIVVQAMNEAVSSEMAHSPHLYEDLYTLQYADDGQLQSIQANASALNQARSALMEAVETALTQLQQTELEIPFGSLTGITALGGLGPAWKLTLLPDAYVEGDLREEVQSVPVNRTQYSITLNLQVTISMVLDGNTSTARVSDQVLIASVLLNGDTPAYYAAGT